MVDGVGLSVGASNLAAVVVGRAAVSRASVLTRFPHRSPEVGVPSENPNLNERGLILTDFVDRVGDPVPIVAADGSTHQADVVLADALRALLLTLTAGRAAGPVAVTHPAHWRQAAVDGLRSALATMPEFQSVTVVSDATAALTALHDDPGLPTRGVIALCDFGGSGTSITLVDAGAGYAPLAPTVRHRDLSGDLVDQALLTHVINDLSAAGSIDLAGTSALGSLTELRGQCCGAKERLSTTSVTSLMVDVPGHRGEVRLNRTELDDAIRQPVAEFAGVLQDELERNSVRELAAVATVGGAARIPILTTTLSEHFRVPVITNGQPELAAAIGGGLSAVRATVDDDSTSIAAAALAPAADATALAPEVSSEPAPSGSFGALAWSDAGDVPDVAPSDPYDYDAPVAAGVTGDVRPEIEFQRDRYEPERVVKPLPWYRRPEVAMGAGVVVVLIALAAAVLFVLRTGDTPPAPASTTAPPPAPTTTAASPAPSETQAPPPETVTQEAPPPPVTETVTPPPATTEAPPPPTTTTEPPPPPTTTEPPPPPTTTEPPPPPASNPPPVIPTLPYETIPGLPFVPNPVQPAP